MDVYCHGKSKIRLENVYEWRHEYSHHLANVRPVIKCPHPLKGGTPFTAIGNIYVPYVVMANGKLDGIEPNVLKLVAEYFEVPLVLANEQMDVHAYINGEIGVGPVRRVGTKFFFLFNTFNKFIF